MAVLNVVLYGNLWRLLITVILKLPLYTLFFVVREKMHCSTILENFETEDDVA